MSDPAVLVVSDETDTLKSLVGVLERRFGGDYRILTDRPSPAALARLQAVCEGGEEVVLVIADSLEWLASTRDVCPRGVRCILVRYGEATRLAVMRRALVMGDVDTYLVTPWGNPEERLYPLVSEILSGWARSAFPPVPILRIVGERWSQRCSEMRDLLSRSKLPYAFHEHDSDEGRRVLAEVGHAGDLPAVIFGRLVLVDPTNREIAEVLGAPTQPEATVYDVVVVGAGPAGLAAAVYGASNGLRTLVVERQTFGGQAGTSSMIRNYLGFPRGIGGAELASRAHEQALSLGAEFIVTRSVTGLAADGAERVVTLTGGTEVRARSVVIATGVAYNRLDVDGVAALAGKGVFYGAATAEAPAFSGEDVIVIGGGNSAGQAVVHLSRYAAAVTLLVRGESLTMSDYLVRQIQRADNVRIRFHTELARAEGERRLDALVIRDIRHATTERVPCAALFVLIGAGAHTSWLADTLQRDGNGYILTGRHVGLGADAAPAWPRAHAPHVLETSLPGAFAAGDVRHGSPKGVAAAVADGAIAIRSVQEYLADE